ncbi:DNA repair exonuclease SbcCD nuclease subunit [Saccharopolyspora shandongensis]|uniref:DNA repair exonuclease SbcCD nuclease subunit n=1 Tax=Saccharopolyspora shandongensis TaxID=418495 RepID=A0A1H3S9M5_9PSEU|nr:DNA repair exonuclease [Saccharopolyspora shandongensis]SDZ34265.1 DNA repair exonuclease SbcCD nuclease subunit [Saccharopolyspora shandongensis]
MSMKLLHAADLHLDSPLLRLSQLEGAQDAEIALATRHALDGLVDLALREEVSAVLLAGDIYDGDWRDHQTGMFFVQRMQRLREANIEVFVVHGNHDVASQITRSLALPDNVHTRPTDAPATKRREDLGLSVHGQGFAERKVVDNLAAAYPKADSGMLNVGLLHTALEGGREPHGRYAPCTVDDLIDKGYQYWALGHVHNYEAVSRDPWVVFPGNLQGRNPREIGPKGCVVVDTDDGVITSVRRHHLDVVRWEHVRPDVSGCRDVSEIRDRVNDALREQLQAADGRPLAVRVELAADTATQPLLWRDPARLEAEVRLVAFELGHIWVEKVRAAPAVEETIRATLDTATVSNLRAAAEELVSDPVRLRDVLADSGLTGPVWNACKDGGLEVDDHSIAQAIVRDAVSHLAAHLPAGAGEVQR